MSVTLEFLQVFNPTLYLFDVKGICRFLIFLFTDRLRMTLFEKVKVHVKQTPEFLLAD